MARGPQLITIFWRDIPAQVNTKSRTDTHKILMKPRFQKAIDRAAMVADITTASDYVNEWRRVAIPATGDLEAAANAEADRLDTEFDKAKLEELVLAGGFDTTKTPNTAEIADIASQEPGASA